MLLDEVAKAVTKKEDVRQLLILDNDCWHKSWSLNCHHFEPKFLPGYSPDFNPIEQLWPHLKADRFLDFIARTEQEITARLCTAIKSFLATRTKPPPSAPSGND